MSYINQTIKLTNNEYLPHYIIYFSYIWFLIIYYSQKYLRTKFSYKRQPTYVIDFKQANLYY
jgi:hypothetical protein